MADDKNPEETPRENEEGGEEETAKESEEAQVYFEPVVQLDEVDVVSGEEEEEVIFKMRCKVFVFGETLLDVGTGKKNWKERGTGDVRFLKHKELQKIRVLMRQEKTWKICINHLVDHRVELQQNIGSDRSWVWSAYDFSEGKVENQVFAVRFASPENAQKFKEAYDAARENNRKLEAGEDAADTSKGDEAAEALSGLKVEGKKAESPKKEAAE